MTDGFVLILLIGCICFGILGILLGRWSVYEQISDAHNLRVIEAELDKRKNDMLSHKDVRDIIERAEDEL